MRAKVRDMEKRMTLGEGLRSEGEGPSSSSESERVRGRWGEDLER